MPGKEISLRKTIFISFLSHALLLSTFLVAPKVFKPKKMEFSAIQVAIVGNFKDLPLIPKKDAFQAVPTAFGQKSASLTVKKTAGDKTKDGHKSAEKMKFNLSTNAVEERKNIINRLKRIHNIKSGSGEKGKNSSDRSTGGRGSPDGMPGIEGTTLAQAAEEGVQNWYIQKVAQKISVNFFIPPKFDGDNPGLITVIVLRLQPDGTILHIEIMKSSGNNIYDDLAYGAVKNSAPFGKIPDEFRDEFREVGFGLRLKRSDFD